MVPNKGSHWHEKEMMFFSEGQNRIRMSAQTAISSAKTNLYIFRLSFKSIPLFILDYFDDLNYQPTGVSRQYKCDIECYVCKIYMYITTNSC